MRSNHHWMHTRINNDGTINKDFQEDEPFIIQLTEVSIIIDESGPLNDVNGELIEFVDDELKFQMTPHLSQN